MARVGWILYDPVDSETYNFPINPNDGGSPSYKKNMVYENTAAPDGKVLMFEGRDDPKQTSFSGILLTEGQYNSFVTWFQKRHQVAITDDLGRTFSIYITSFDPKRKRSAIHPWKHEYTCEYTIIDWAS